MRACAIDVPVFRNRKDERYDAETSCTVSGIPNLSCPAVSQYGEPVVLFQPVSIIQKLRVQTLQIRAVFIQRPDYVCVKRYSPTTLVHPPNHNLTPASVFFKGRERFFQKKIHTGPGNPVWCPPHLLVFIPIASGIWQSNGGPLPIRPWSDCHCPDTSRRVP